MRHSPSRAHPDKSFDPQAFACRFFRGGFYDCQVKRAARERFGEIWRRCAHERYLHVWAGFRERLEDGRKARSHEVVRHADPQRSLQWTRCHVRPDLVVHSKQAFRLAEKTFADPGQFKAAALSLEQAAIE